MSFEIREKDLLGRIGKLKTKSGTIETPVLLPVVNPAFQPIPPRQIREEFGFEALITNAYILKQRFQNEPVREGLHKFLNFDGAIMTDSGAYQILVYGDVKTNQDEIVNYQEQIGTDIATILDIPTGWRVTEECAGRTVKETLKRARRLSKIKRRDDILWVGPVQGGKYLDLVAKSAREMGRLPFSIHALGSPTEVMERYRFDVLLEMIMTAKMNLPLDRPLHLFGAGHPFMFAFAVALGCDLFDSAAYALYARECRYLTENGTHRLNELEYFPCACPKCNCSTPKKVLELETQQRFSFLAEHNLYACGAEMRRVKQAVEDGRLWEYVEMRALSHPALLQALKKVSKYKEFIEENSPSTKHSGLFFFDSLSLMRPEIVHYEKTFSQRYTKPGDADTLVLLPQTEMKPFHKSIQCKQVEKIIRQQLRKVNGFHVCFYAAPFGVIPNEIDEVYPVSQHETVVPPDSETVRYVAAQVANYVNRTNYRGVILVNDPLNWGKTVLSSCRDTCRTKKIGFAALDVEKVQVVLPKILMSLRKTDDLIR
ncbi:MAG TPA: tRNA guanosine(15) transglycosylase TgtA [Candidatus Acidoferrum sp.]|nr:tRNA guanosine(15) transglycosylase TgtA [Candidatus Acidoferrum sp.]